jgi:hypothetical protein
MISATRSIPAVDGVLLPRLISLYSIMFGQLWRELKGLTRQCSILKGYWHFLGRWNHERGFEVVEGLQAETAPLEVRDVLLRTFPSAT